MNSGSAASTSSSLYANWLPSGVWQGLFSGNYLDYNGGLAGQGNYGSYWSSTVSDYTTSEAYYLGFNDESVTPHYFGGKRFSYAVRCAI